MSATTQNKNRKPLILFCLVFILPLVLAWLALQTDWFNRGATNKGELLSPVVEMPELLRGETPVWRLLYIMPEDCDAACNNAISSINQVWQASGREKKRVIPTVLVIDNSDSQARQTLAQEEHITIIKTEAEQLSKMFKNQSVDGIFIADTLGNIILRYPLYTEEQQAVLKSRDILADLRKLLKLSRIG